MRIVIALGGNALIKKGQKGTGEEQMETAEEAVSSFREIIEENEIVITHGNGPQVGNELIRVEMSRISKFVREKSRK